MAKNNRKVVIMSGAARDFSAAEKYGELVFIGLGSTNIVKTDRHIADILKALKPLYIENYQTPPYVLITGHGVLSGLLLLCVMEVWGSCELLIWDVKENTYSPAKVSKKVVRNYFNTSEGGK